MPPKYLISKVVSTYKQKKKKHYVLRVRPHSFICFVNRIERNKLNPKHEFCPILFIASWKRIYHIKKKKSENKFSQTKKKANANYLITTFTKL